jgi:5'-3' exonuclease
MKHKDLLNLLNQVKEDNDQPILKKHDKVLLIDGLNLFFRNFTMMKHINPDGVHIGGLGGFIRSLGFLIRTIQPTSVYVVFDGVGSSANRKNILPEYKSGRNLVRITNWEVFDSLEEEDNSKIDQIVRLIQYLKTLPIKVITFPKVEADDIIALLSQELTKESNSQVYIVSSDQDFLQLATDKIIIYRPIQKEFYNANDVKNKFEVLAENFILYKVLLGDNSDKIPGIKGLGPKGIFKKFPELKERPLTMKDLFEISKNKLKEHVVYARVIQDFNRLKDNYKIMNLGNPLIDDMGVKYIKAKIQEDLPNLESNAFTTLYNEDKMGGMIRNIDTFLKENFAHLTHYKK